MFSKRFGAIRRQAGLPGAHGGGFGRFAIGALALGVALAAPAEARAYGYDECPVLDAPHHAWREIEVGYVAAADVDAPGWNRTAMFETRIHGLFLYWANDWGGDLDIRGEADFLTLQGFRRTGSLHTFARVRIPIEWSQRFIHGYGLRLGVEPGLYSSLHGVKGDGFGFPFTLEGTWHLGPVFGAHAGAAVAPGFSRVIDPRAGVIWRFDDRAVIALAYPETELSVSLFHVLRLFAGARWSSPEFSMGRDARGRMQVVEARAWAGIEARLGEHFGLTLSGGRAFERRFRFDEGPGVDLDDATFVHAGAVWLY